MDNSDTPYNIFVAWLKTDGGLGELTDIVSMVVRGIFDAAWTGAIAAVNWLRLQSQTDCNKPPGEC